MGTIETIEVTGAAAHIIKRPRLTKILDETDARIILLCAERLNQAVPLHFLPRLSTAST